MTKTVQDEAFRDFVDPHVRDLRLHCYRLLGSVDDADEILQEALLAAWRAMPTFEGRASPRTWLFRIATNRCLNAIRDGKRRPPVAPLPPFDPPTSTEQHPATWVQPLATDDDPAGFHDRREHIELAFITALQTIPPRQAAALVLVEVLGFSLSEAAGLLDVPATTAKGLLQRARAGLASQRGGNQHSSREVELATASRFADAFVKDDVDAVLALLTDDAWLAMPPAPHLYRGRDAIGAFLHASFGWRRGERTVSLSPIWANQAPAFTVEMSDDGVTHHAGLVVLDITDRGIEGITRFLHGVDQFHGSYTQSSGG